jgi:FkbM family methyltransferase
MRAWSVVGQRVGIKRRLEVSRWLGSRVLDSGVPYRTPRGFALSIDSADPFQCAMAAGLYDPLVQELLRRFVVPGGVVIDAGAHLGFFTLLCAQLVGPRGSVHSFECDPRLAPRLRGHVELNGAGAVTVNACGLLDRDSEVELSLPTQLGWSSTLAGAWGATETATVAMVSLDEYLHGAGVDPTQLCFIKLDVEGSELKALRGAARTLAATQAPVLVEYLPGRMAAMGENPADLPALMGECGYAPWSPAAVAGGVRLAPGAQPAVGEDVLFIKGRPTEAQLAPLPAV